MYASILHEKFYTNEKHIRKVTCDNTGNVCVVHPIAGIAKQYFLSTNGLGTGTIQATGNYAAAATDFYVTATSRYEICSILINISDNSTFNQLDYGGVTTGTVLNGVKFFVQPSGMAELPLLSGYAIKANYEWATLTHDIQLTTFAGTAQTLIVNFMVIEDYGKPITLNTGDKFIVRLNDNFTGLTAHTFGLRGILY